MPAWGFEFHSLTENAIAYDASSKQARPKLILLRNTPIEQITSANHWVKIRDANGSIAWIEEKFVGNAKTVIVIASNAQIRLQPKDDAPVVFVASKNVVLETLDSPSGGWVKVRHPDGETGYASLRQVWGI